MLINLAEPVKEDTHSYENIHHGDTVKGNYHKFEENHNLGF